MLLTGLTTAAIVQATPVASATALVDSALASAKAEHKGVLVIFHASWCGWCKQLDKTMEMPALKSVLDKDFVVLHVTVLEDAAHKADENPGGVDLLAKLGGNSGGIPYYAMMNDDGKVVADSRVAAPGTTKPQNMGYPTEPNELDHFLAMLTAGNPQVTPEEAKAIHKVLSDRAAEIKAKLKH